MNTKTLTYIKKELDTLSKSQSDSQIPNITKNCLKLFKNSNTIEEVKTLLTLANRLVNNLPLTPITEDDFRYARQSKFLKEFIKDSDVVSLKECPRMKYLVRREFKDGTVDYSDLTRVLFTDVNTEETFHLAVCVDLIDTLYPIQLPYFPNDNEYFNFVGTTYYVDDNNKSITPPREGMFNKVDITGVFLPNSKFVELNYTNLDV